MSRFFLLPLLLLCWVIPAVAQTPADTTVQVSTKYLESVASKAGSIEDKLDRKTEKMLARLQKQEAKMKKKLMKIDSSAAARVFGSADTKYKELEARLHGKLKGPYVPKLDSLATSINFLQNNPQLLKQAKETKQKLDDALSKVKGLKDQLNKAEELKKFLKERKQFLKEQLSKFGFAKELKKLNKEVYYYAQQVNEYKEILKDSKKAEKKALELLSKTKFFKDFMRKNSELASLFRMPGDPSDPSSQANLAGLQTRAQVNSLIQQQIAAGGPGAQQQVSQNIQNAQAQLNQLKDRILKAGGSGADDELPDFKPNNQKTKGFWKRLELGTNVQTQKATNYFPVTSDIGLSVGYKLNDKSVVGIGASYKMGWGRGWRDLTITHQGLGLRSYVDLKLKGSFWLSGGYEQNYRSAFNSMDQLQDLNAWQQSGLIGVSKMVSLKTKFFKKTKIQLLWDFLSYEQVPRTQPITFRIGYNF
ncbi:MAG TPA: hypothetical protein VHM26_11270 [Chitinophagaceae bacterium]|nr:hypothetical protein [Chitinophagaceae bacterium]